MVAGNHSNWFILNEKLQKRYSISNYQSQLREYIDLEEELFKKIGRFLIYKPKGRHTEKLNFDNERGFQIMIAGAEYQAMPGETTICFEFRQTQHRDAVKISITRQNRMKDLYMQILLHLDDDFDYDLLLETIHLLT